MKRLLVIWCAIITSFLCSCGPNGTHGGPHLSSKETDGLCLSECTNSYMKADNKCSLDFPDDYVRQTECSSKLKQRMDKCAGKCMGNL